MITETSSSKVEFPGAGLVVEQARACVIQQGSYVRVHNHDKQNDERSLRDAQVIR
jgi:hypothetical protein